jgi:hypothetical protein|uniref:hypothetical protein n=1 Tax=Alistipes onderdonkii TaxID=328813 RepID=UPI00206D0E19|nr:MAG TPA: hypothetical protein [Caudoviricetes sp.]
MKDFDLRAAKRGAAVCTKAGKLVRIISFDSDHSFCGVPQPIAAELEADNGDGTLYFCENGRYYPGSVNSSYDLRMRDDDYAEKLARGEYGNHIDEATEKVDPTFKENLTVDREYWRRVYAGQAMMGIFAGRSWPKDGAPDCINYARNAIELAEALIEELEKQRNDE